MDVGLGRTKISVNILQAGSKEEMNKSFIEARNNHEQQTCELYLMPVFKVNANYYMLIKL